MMKKIPIVPIIVMIAALALSIVAARKVEEGRTKLNVKSEQFSRVYLPHLGIDKFVADLKWVKLVQEMGWHAQKTMTRNAALYFADAADSITDLDPNMSTVYQMVSLHITHHAPERAIALLQKARKYALNPDWLLSFYSGHIAERYLPEGGTPDRMIRAEGFYADACGISGHAAYADRAWMRCAVRSAGEDPVKRLLAEKRFVLRLEAKLARENREADRMGAGSEGGFSIMEEDSSYSRLRKTVIANARQVTGDLLAQYEKERDPSKKKVLDGELAKARDVFDALKPKGNICSNCLATYNPGQFFCSNCSNKVKAYGYCRECWAKGQLILLQGTYCHICGGKGL